MLTEWIVKESKLCFNNNLLGIGLRGRPKNRWLNCVQIDINNSKITNWKETSKRADWKKYL
jgi:hypothetical protein